MYPADPVAQRYGAAVPVETSIPGEAYKPFTLRTCGYEDGWLPD